MLTTGAAPLFLLDYVAANRISLDEVAELVEGAAEVCRAAGVALLGGETAELPGIYRDDELDFAGTCVGLVDRDRLVDGSAIREGDVVVGFPSAGVHANGFTLVRRVLEEEDYTATTCSRRPGSTSTRFARWTAPRPGAHHGGGSRATWARVPDGPPRRDRLGELGAPTRLPLARPARRGGRAAACLQPRDRLLRRRARPGGGQVIGRIVAA